jgi:chitinase
MRAAFGYQLGISFALAPDYGDMRYTDAYGMRPFLDWFNLMAYDMNYGSTVLKAHTDIRDITALTRNLFANNIDMSKVNLGLAYYGRGFTLGNKNCNTLDNSCAGTAKVSAYGCSSGTDGVLTLADIKSLIQSRGLTPTYNSDAMVQTITWDNNWIAYDDEKTLPLKRNWATQNCFGGTAIWSVDLYNKGRAY